MPLRPAHSLPPRRGTRALITSSAGLMLLLAACSGSTTTSSAPAAPTNAPATQTQPQAAAPAQPTTAPTVPAQAQPPTAAAAPAVPTRASTSTQHASSTHLTFAQGESEARFHAREVLAGATTTNDAIGRTSDVTGTLVIEPSGAIDVERSKITANLQSLKSDQSLRDQVVHRFELQTDKFPTAEFLPRKTEGLSFPLPTSGDATFKLDGDLTVHGVTKPATWDVTAQFAPDSISGSAVVPTTLADWDMPVPKVPRVASIEDVLKIELDFRAARSSD